MVNCRDNIIKITVIICQYKRVVVSDLIFFVNRFGKSGKGTVLVKGIRFADVDRAVFFIIRTGESKDDVGVVIHFIQLGKNIVFLSVTHQGIFDIDIERNVQIFVVINCVFAVKVKINDLRCQRFCDTCHFYFSSVMGEIKMVISPALNKLFDNLASVAGYVKSKTCFQEIFC